MEEIVQWMQDNKGSRVAALLSKVCGGNDKILDAVLRGEEKIVLEKAIQLLFNRHGRRIPKNLSQAAFVRDADYKFDYNMELEIDFTNRLVTLVNAFSGILAPGRLVPSVSGKFENEIQRLVGLIDGNSQVANILIGPWLPIVLPRLTTSDPGTVLEQYLAAVGKSYTSAFSGRRFVNHRKGGLTKEVSVSRWEGDDGEIDFSYDQLLERNLQESIVAIYFPSALQGFSSRAGCEQMKDLPEGFVSPGFGTAIAMAMYPDILARDYNTPVLGLHPLFSNKHPGSFNFHTTNDSLIFDYTTSNSTHADECSSDGLLFVG